MNQEDEIRRTRKRIKRQLIAMVARSLFLHRKRLFVDCGSNLGQGYSFFKRFFRPVWYDAVLVEPNPNCMQTLRQKFGDIANVEFVEAAAGTRKQKLKLFGLVEDGRGAMSAGASVVVRHNRALYETDADRAIEVEAFSFSEWIVEKAREYDQIIVKLDIESSEYGVLQDLLDNDSARHVQHYFVEFHSEYFHESEQAGYRDLETKLVRELEDRGIGVTTWI